MLNKNNIELIKKTDNEYLYEIKTKKRDHASLRIIKITTDQDLIELVDNALLINTQPIFTFVTSSEKNDDDIWEVNYKTDKFWIIKLKKKTNAKKIINVAPIKQNLNLKPKTSDSQIQINNYENKLNQIQDIVLNLQTTMKQNIEKSFQMPIQNIDNTNEQKLLQLETKLLLMENKIDKQNFQWENEKINSEQQKNLFTQEIIKLNEKIENLKNNLQYKKLTNKTFEIKNTSYKTEEKSINNINKQKNKQRRDWTYRGFIRTTVFCTKKNINLINTEIIDQKTTKYYEIYAFKNHKKRIIKVKTQNDFYDSLNLTFWIPKELENSDHWNINDEDNGIKIFINNNIKT